MGYTLKLKKEFDFDIERFARFNIDYQTAKYKANILKFDNEEDIIDFASYFEDGREIIDNKFALKKGSSFIRIWNKGIYIEVVIASNDHYNYNTIVNYRNLKDLFPIANIEYSELLI